MDRINMNVFKQIKKIKRLEADKDFNSDKIMMKMPNKSTQLKKKYLYNDLSEKQGNFNADEISLDKLNLRSNKVTTVTGYIKDSNTNCIEKQEFKIKTRSQPEPNFNYTKGNAVSSMTDQEQKMCKDILVDTVKKNKLSKGTTIMMENERVHANEAIESGIYITWVSKLSTGEKVECFRIGSNSTCVCSHGFNSHDKIVTKKKFSAKCQECKCRSFIYIPVFPEEIGEYWLSYQPNFDYKTWKAKCKCKHFWSEHSAEQFLKCNKCNCFAFNSNFCCAVCDKFWQDHEMSYELEHERYMNKKPIGEDFIPFTEMPEMYNALYKK